MKNLKVSVKEQYKQHYKVKKLMKSQKNNKQHVFKSYEAIAVKLSTRAKDEKYENVNNSAPR